MALPNFTISPYVKPYVGNANKEVDELVVQRRQDYDLAAETADVLGYQTDTLKQNINPFEPDALYAGELINKYRGQIDQWAERGDYENLIREVKRSTRQFQQEVSPLLARRKAFDDYRKTVQEQYQKGEIDLEMHNAALNKTKLDNSNVDKATVMSGAFSGFLPSKKVDVSKMLDDAIKGMEAQGKVGKMILDPSTGTYKVVGGEYRSAKDIYNAAMSYLQGSSEFRNYASTLNALGLTDKLNAESLAGLNYVQQKYQFDKSTLSGSGFFPEWFYDKNTVVNPSLNLQDISSKNVHVGDRYKGYKVRNGVLFDLEDNYTDYVNGKVLRFRDKNSGQLLTKDEVVKRGFSEQGGTSSIVQEEVTKESQIKERNQLQEQLRNDSRKKFLVEGSMQGKVPAEWLNNPQQYQQQIDDYLKVNERRWGSSDYMQQTLVDYKDAIKNAGVMNNNKVWAPVETRASLKRKGEELNIPNIIRNIAGREVYELGAEASPTREGKMDISSFLEESQKKGKLKDVTYLGLAQINALSNQPGQRYDFIYEDSDGKTFKKSVIVPIQDAALQPMQDVMAAAMSGKSTEIKAEDIYIPSTNRYMNLKFDVFSVPNPNKEMRKVVPFVGTVFVSDKNGNKTSIDLANFPQYYRNLIPTEVEKYLK